MISKLNEVPEKHTKEKVALTEEQEQALLSFIKMDNVSQALDDADTVKNRTSYLELCGTDSSRY